MVANSAGVLGVDEKVTDEQLVNRPRPRIAAPGCSMSPMAIFHSLRGMNCIFGLAGSARTAKLSERIGTCRPYRMVKLENGQSASTAYV
jgi:hypothetical protein